MQRFLAPACLLFLLGSCRTDGGASEPARSPSSTPLPASALLGAVRALETLGAVRPEGTLVRLRALESDSMVEPGSGREMVRVFLHLTVYSQSTQRSFDAFEELRLALQDEARAANRAEQPSSERVQRVFGALDWEPVGSEDLVSYSDVVRLEIQPGSPAPQGLGGQESGVPRMAVEAYVRSHGASEGLALDLSMRSRESVGNTADLRCRIQSVGTELHTRAQIGAFLGQLEAGSPATRVTHLEVARSWEAPDLQAARVWTFEAELAVRAAQ